MTKRPKGLFVLYNVTMTDQNFKDTRDMNGEYEGKVDNSLVKKAFNSAYPQEKDAYVPKNKQESKADDYYNKPSCFVVDGYNLMHAIQELDDISKNDLMSAREKLIDLLCDYKAIMKTRLIVVFDAYKVETGKEDYTYDGINIVYTKEGELADSYIERLVLDLVKDYKVTVVTSDALEQALVFAHGALRMSSDQFISITNEKLQRAYHKHVEEASNAYKNRPLEELSKLNIEQ